jgi:hypothetical protein
MRATRPRLEGSLTLVAVAGDEPGNPAGRDPIVTGDLPDAAAFDNDCGDDEPGT